MDRSPRSCSTLERELPESVRSLIQRKIDALDDNDRRLLAAASVQGMDFDSAMLSRRSSVDEEEVEDRARAAGARARARAVRAGSRESRPVADAAVPVRASHLSQRVLRLAAGDTAGGAEPRHRRTRWCSASGEQPGDRLRTSRCCSKRRATTIRAAEYWNHAAQAAGAALRARRNGAAGAARPGAARRTSQRVPTARPPSSGCR